MLLRPTRSGRSLCIEPGPMPTWLLLGAAPGTEVLVIRAGEHDLIEPHPADRAADLLLDRVRGVRYPPRMGHDPLPLSAVTLRAFPPSGACGAGSPRPTSPPPQSRRCGAPPPSVGPSS